MIIDIISLTYVACGDSVVDTDLGEQCETGGEGCTDCQCDLDYKTSGSTNCVLGLLLVKCLYLSSSLWRQYCGREL